MLYGRSITRNCPWHHRNSFVTTIHQYWQKPLHLEKVICQIGVIIFKMVWCEHVFFFFLNEVKGCSMFDQREKCRKSRRIQHFTYFGGMAHWKRTSVFLPGVLHDSCARTLCRVCGCVCVCASLLPHSCIPGREDPTQMDGGSRPRWSWPAH